MNVVEYLNDMIEKHNIWRTHQLFEHEDIKSVDSDFYDSGRHVQYWRHVVKTPYGYAEIIVGMIGVDFDEEEDDWEINEVFPKVIQTTIYTREEQ